jgi:hypothetical protein
MRKKMRSSGLLGMCLLVACGGTVATEGPESGSPNRDAGREPDTATLPDTSRRDAVSQPDAPGAKDASHAPDASSVAPLNHRPDDSECTAPAPAGDCVGGNPGTPCATDADCTQGATMDAGVDGRCINDGPLPGCHCTFDTCIVDTDCPMGDLCVCHGSAYTGGGGNTCMAGNCRVDSDCGANGYCSPSASGGCGSVGGYYCHTASDSCVNDGDCGGDIEECVWSSADGRWECQMDELCG